MVERSGPLSLKPRRITIAPVAQRQIDSLLHHSERTFGQSTADRYRALVLVTIDRLAIEPAHALSRPAPVRRPTFMIHLRYFKRDVPPGVRIASPRHLIVYRYSAFELEIVQVLDDRMDLPNRLR